MKTRSYAGKLEPILRECWNWKVKTPKADALASLILFDLKICRLETAINNCPLDLCFAYGIAKSILGMGITMIIDFGSINKICLAVNAYSKIAGFALQSEFTLATGCFNQLCLFLMDPASLPAYHLTGHWRYNQKEAGTEERIFFS